MRRDTGWLFVLLVLVLFNFSAGIACHALSPSPWDQILIKHKWDAIPENWVSLGPPPNDTIINLHIALKANSENALVDALHEVSHPRHPKNVLFTGTSPLEAYSRVLRFRYGAHLSREQVAELVAPHSDTFELVCSWLKHNGVPPSSISMSHGGGWLTIAGVPVLQANKLLGASYELYYHANSNDTILRTVSYAIPVALHMHVKTIAPTTAFTSMNILQQTALHHSGGEAAPANVTSGGPLDVLSRGKSFFAEPSELRWLYRMPLNDPAPTDRNKLGIAGFKNESPDQDDLRQFIAKFRSDVDEIVASTRIMTVVPVNGGVEAGDFPGRRANTDTQYSVALTFPTPIEYYTIGGVKGVTPFGPLDDDKYLVWLRYMIDLENVPWTISVPYFTRELDLPAEYATSLCGLFEILSARGVSILVPSGDEAVGRLTRGKCVRFSTSFPASCPYVTSVGGTTEFDPELGSKFSGGGFSEFFERPDYQIDAVPPYLDNLGLQYFSLYNPRGRGVPDIALQSVNYGVFWQGRFDVTGSTTFSTNTAAAIIALLNDYLVSNNKHPLGFLNYWLYEAGLYWDGLNDVTGGNNPSCKTDGFSATDGWDPITGLGSLNYTLLLQHLIEWA